MNNLDVQNSRVRARVWARVRLRFEQLTDFREIWYERLPLEDIQTSYFFIVCVDHNVRICEVRVALLPRPRSGVC